MPVISALGEAEAGECWAPVQDQPGLHGEFQVSVGYRIMLSQNKPTNDEVNLPD